MEYPAPGRDDKMIYWSTSASLSANRPFTVSYVHSRSQPGSSQGISFYHGFYIDRPVSFLFLSFSSLLIINGCERSWPGCAPATGCLKFSTSSSILVHSIWPYPKIPKSHDTGMFGHDVHLSLP